MNILITTIGINAPFFFLFRDALGNKGKIFVSNSKETSFFSLADGYVLSPRIYDETYIDFLITYCLKNDIKAVFSFSEMDIIVLAKNKERFKEKGIELIVSDQQVIEICNDKWRCHQFLSSIGLKQPKTYIDINLLKNDLSSGIITFPLIFKPRWGVGSIGLFQVDTFEEIDIIYQKSFREIFDSFLRFESEQNKDFCVLMMEKLTGQEYGLDVLNDLQGNYITTIPKTKTEMQEGETVVSTVEPNGPFIHTGKTISQNLKHIGNIGVDCFLTDSGDVLVIEINPRFAAHYPFAHLAGANFPKQIFEWLSGNPTNNEYITCKIGVTGYKNISHIYPL